MTEYDVYNILILKNYVESKDDKIHRKAMDEIERKKNVIDGKVEKFKNEVDIILDKLEYISSTENDFGDYFKKLPLFSHWFT